jgi:hypothetical protein
MKHSKVKLGVALLLCLGLHSLHAQVAAPTSGGNATGNGGTVSYTVGQVVYTVESSNGSVAQGVQQPYTISMVTGLEGTEGITLHYDVYPNPTNHSVTLKVEDFKTTSLIYELYDLTGKQLESKKVKAIETSINMSDYVQAAYFIKVIDGNREVKIFKILKIN